MIYNNINEILLFFTKLMKLFKFIELNDYLFNNNDEYISYLKSIRICSNFLSNIIIEDGVYEINIGYDLSKEDVNYIYNFYKVLNEIEIFYKDCDNYIEFVENYDNIRFIIFKYLKDMLDNNIDNYNKLSIYKKIILK